MTPPPSPLPSLDPRTTQLVRLAAALAGSDEARVRLEMTAALDLEVPVPWVEELVLQTYLFAGFPRALNGAREWRRLLGERGIPTPPDVPDDAATFRARGEETCAVVYGPFYGRLRENIRALHPALDEWMIVEGYGKVLSRPGLDLGRRELCIVAACAATGQDRQLHAHLHGARHAGVGPGVVAAAVAALADLIPSEPLTRARLLLVRVLGRP